MHIPERNDPRATSALFPLCRVSPQESLQFSTEKYHRGMTPYTLPSRGA